jgi:hypothetical protein
VDDSAIPVDGGRPRDDRRMDAPEPLHFACPRCHAEVAEPFYGPCPSCRTELRAAFAGAARQVEVADYEPKVNVTPNAVGAARGDE